MSAASVALSLAPLAFDLIERLIDECGEDPVALAQLEQRLASLSSRVSRVRTPAAIVSAAAEDRRRELRDRDTDPASGPTPGQT